jgi:hypothetical protein
MAMTKNNTSKAKNGMRIHKIPTKSLPCRKLRFLFYYIIGVENGHQLIKDGFNTVLYVSTLNPNWGCL